jgi:MFS family permease
VESQELQQPISNNQRFYYGYVIAGVAFICAILNAGMSVSFGVFFKPLLNDFGWTRAMTSGAFSVYWTVQAISSVVMGGLNDKIGPRLVISFSGLLFGAGYLLMSQVNSIWQLYLFYGLVAGIGTCGIAVALKSTIVRWFTKNLVISIMGACGSLGALVFPLVATRLIAAYDWRTSFAMIGGFVLVIVVLLAQFLKRAPVQMRQVSYTGDSQNIYAGSEGLNLNEALHTRQFWLAFTIHFIQGFLMATIMVHIVPHANDLGISALNAANILAIIGGIGMIGSIATGIAGDKFGIKRTFIIIFIVMASAYFWISTVEELWMFYLFAVVFGLARHAGLLSASLVAELFGLKAHGLIFGVINLASSLGAALGPFLAGYIFDITDSYTFVFLSCGALGIVAAMISSFLRTNQSQQKATNKS